MTSEHDSARSEKELIQSAASGDVEAFAEIYDHYLLPIYRYIFYRVSDVLDAEDLTEEVFLRVWERLQTSGTGAGIKNFNAWLYRIAHNLVVDHYRKGANRKHEDVLEEGSALNPESGAEEAFVHQMEIAALEVAISGLEDPLQQIIILRFINRLSHAETAEILGLKEGHVRVLQYRALKKLRTSLEKEK